MQTRTSAPLLAALMLIASQNIVHAQEAKAHSHDAIASAPDHHKVLLENESVRVLETRIAPGERTPVHAHHWPRCLVRSQLA
jgi:quercetin dioxygenase-like cupin family protein